MLSIFQAYGVELEYMILDRETFRPVPIAESILLDENGHTVQEINLGSIDVSNELATHVLEFKTAKPTSDFDQLQLDFQKAVSEINRRLAAFNAVLAPTGIHPFMDPKTEGKTWSKGNRVIYETYNRIFDCHRHGWLNLQSCHLNLPFSNEEEFAVLHASVILILPYLPALSASSPYIEGEHRGFLDTRLDIYRSNQSRVPEIAGNIVPEAVFTFSEYQSEILEKTYKAIAPFDPDHILQEEWLNSRGAIARFDRNAIEIRVLDTQENPGQDLAICSLIIAVLQTLCAMPAPTLRAVAAQHSTLEKKSQFLEVARSGLDAPLQLRDFASLVGLSENCSTVRELWIHLLKMHGEHPLVRPRLSQLQAILEHGNLAERIIRMNGKTPTRNQLTETLSLLSQSLAATTSFA